jgi:hypothetical protein
MKLNYSTLKIIRDKLIYKQLVIIANIILHHYYQHQNQGIIKQSNNSLQKKNSCTRQSKGKGQNKIFMSVATLCELLLFVKYVETHLNSDCRSTPVEKH